jgi:PTH2 family peptidyl-tRNA hydrolase
MSNVKQVLVVRKDLQMTKGKIAAQCAHAAMKFLADRYEPGSSVLEAPLNPQQVEWLTGAFAKVVVYVESEQEMLDLVAAGRRAELDVRIIIDSGRTMFHGVPTLTVAAFGPDEADKLDPVTKHLKLL